VAHDNIEIEVKFPLYNKDDVATYLNSNAQVKKMDVTQIDTYFTPAHKNFLEKEFPFQWLRLREAKGKTILNYKHFFPENVKNIDYCNEYEIEVTENIKHIFQAMEMKELVKVEKKRSTWQLGNVEVAIDEVTGLGPYIELEMTSYVQDTQIAKQNLYSLLKTMNAQIGDEDYRGYPFLLLEKMQQ
jgi:adenylate cyclase, class 2